MIKKLLPAFILIFFAFVAEAQLAPYEFPAPQGWTTEKFTFPLSFAPKIPFKGTEELHLPPGWGKAESDEYWSYVFVWYLDSPGDVGVKELDDYLTQYYTGLYIANLGKKPTPQVGFTHAEIKVASKKEHDKFFEGTITTLDFLTGKPIKFFIRMDMRKLSDGHTVFLNEVSPKEHIQPVWATLDGVINSFKTAN